MSIKTLLEIISKATELFDIKETKTEYIIIHKCYWLSAEINKKTGAVTYHLGSVNDSGSLYLDEEAFDELRDFVALLKQGIDKWDTD